MLVGATDCFSLKISNDTQERIRVSIEAGKMEGYHPSITSALFHLEPGEKWEESQAYTKLTQDAKKLYGDESFMITATGATVPEEVGKRIMICTVESEEDHVSFLIIKEKLSCGVNLKNDSAVPSKK